MFHYQQVLSLDPENQVARDGVRGIVLRYVDLSDSAAASGNRAQAATYLERAASISPNDPEVISARARLASSPPPPPQRAAPAPVARPEIVRPAPAPPPPPAPRWTSFRQAKLALRDRRITEDEYDRIIDELKRRRDSEILRTKAAYVSKEISRDEYGRRIREIKLRYDGRNE
jgi:hypothetical protein